MRFHKYSSTDSVAKQRLRLMVESEPVECAPEVMYHMKKEISDIISKYFELAADKYEVKVILKQKQKRA